LVSSFPTRSPTRSSRCSRWAPHAAKTRSTSPNPRQRIPGEHALAYPDLIDLVVPVMLAVRPSNVSLLHPASLFRFERIP